MFEIFALPSAPAYMVSFAGVLLAAIAMSMLRPQVVGLLRIPAGWDMRTRMLLGQLAGLLVVGLLLAVVAQITVATQQILVAVIALAVYMYFGLVLPRKPKVQAERNRRALRKLTPGFASYVRIALAGYDSPARLLERYTNRFDPRSAPLRAVTAAALETMHRERQRPFAAFRDQARITGCQELIDLTEALAQAEAEGAAIDQVLQQYEQTLMAMLEDEFKRMLKRRTMYLLLLVAISVVVGILGNLLFVMVGGVLFR